MQTNALAKFLFRCIAEQNAYAYLRVLLIRALLDRTFQNGKKILWMKPGAAWPLEDVKEK